MAKRKLREVIEHEGYTLRFEKNYADGSKMFYCSERKTFIGCRALAAQKLDGTIEMKRSHARHEADGDRSRSKMAKLELKEISADLSLSPKDIISKLRDEYGEMPIMIAGSDKTLSKCIQRQRKLLNSGTKNTVNQQTPTTGMSAAED